MSDAKTCYDDLCHNHISELRQNCKDFPGFNLEQLDKACWQLNINAFIFDYEITNGVCDSHPGYLSCRSKFAEGGIQLNMLSYKDPFMFIKLLKALFTSNFNVAITNVVSTKLII